MELIYPLIHIEDVIAENMDKDAGWGITRFCLPISNRQGSSSTMFHATFMPGAVHKRHRHDNCDEIYYIANGRGLSGAGKDRVEVRRGHFHYIPKGVEHWLYNVSDTEALVSVGVYIGAGSVEDTGYVYLGDITEDEIKATRSDFVRAGEHLRKP